MGLFSGPGNVPVNAFTEDPPKGGIAEIGQKYNFTGVIAVNGQAFGYSVVGYEQLGRAVITFFRMYGSFANITLYYSTSDGTATAGTDYTATSGSVTWLSGDKTPKSVSVPLLATSKVVNEYFNFNITGVGIASNTRGVYIFTGGGSILPFPGPRYSLSDSFQVTIVRMTNGTLNFAGTPYSVQRPGGTTTVVLQVARVNGFKGAVGCSFHTTDGTAVAGVAYTGQTGTLSWAANEGGPKTITITILSGGSGTQSFTVTIDTPTGGAAIGSTNIATVDILAGAPPTNPSSPGGIPDQVVDIEAGANPNGEIHFSPQNLVIQDNQSLWNRNFLINSYASTGIRPNLNAVFFISTTVGWAVGDGGFVFKTTDGGATWVAQVSTVNVNLYDVFFSDATHGWAVGAGGTIIATTDGGTTWAAQTSGVATTLNSVYFISNTNGWVVGDGGVILVTTNGGGTWTPQTSGVATDLNDVYFVDATHGWAVGDGGVILFYNGTTWAPETSGVATNLNGVTFTSTTNGWVVGDGGVILVTTNGGAIWTPQVSGTTQDLNEVDFASGTVGWVVGDNGVILSTTNGGGTWTPQSSGTTQDLLSASALSTTVVFVVGEGGVTLGTTNGGGLWDPEVVPLPIGSSGGNGGSFGGGDDYANYDDTFTPTAPARFQGSQY
jgi:photosystem II stability/assembly factor-like uncharacterized protein